MIELLDWATRYATLGWSVLPLHTWTGTCCTCGHTDCSSPAKHPRTRNGLKDASSDPGTIQGWWSRWPDSNIGLRTGEHFDALDVDGDPGFDSVIAVENEQGEAQPGPTSHTGGGGLHRLYQPTGLGNRAGILEHVDWRGKNGYIVAPPSLHSSGNRYEWSPDFPADHPLAKVDGWLADLLFPAPQERRALTSPSAPGSSTAYARRAFDAELGELARAAQGTRNHTLNAAAFNLYQLAAGGELDEQDVTSALTRVAAGIGLGDKEIGATLGSARTAASQHPRTAPKLSVVGNTARKEQPHLETTEPAGTPNDTLEPVTTGWEPVDVAQIIANGCDIPPPTLYTRTDNTCLLYAGKLHAFNGEPESGKSWAAQHAALQTVNTGANVCYIDFEDSPQSVIGRLLDLGADPDTLTRHFTYLQPDRPFSLDAGDVLRTHFETHPPALAVIDGVTEAMSTLGLEPLDNADTAKFFRLLPRPLAKHGAAVILVDHVVKDRENRGRWAIGSQHKMAALTGAAYTVETATPFGRNKHGIAKLIVTKDRPGFIRQYAAGKTVAELHLISLDGTLTAHLQPPSSALSDDGAFQPTQVMEKISRILENGPALSKNGVEKAAGGNTKTVDYALELLITAGHVQVQKQGQTSWHTLIRPYPEPETENDEPY